MYEVDSCCQITGEPEARKYRVPRPAKENENTMFFFFLSFLVLDIIKNVKFVFFSHQKTNSRQQKIEFVSKIFCVPQQIGIVAIDTEEILSSHVIW